MKYLFMRTSLSVALMTFFAYETHASKPSTSGQSTAQPAKTNSTQSTSTSSQSMDSLMKIGKLTQPVVDAFRDMMSKQSVAQLQSFQKDNIKLRDDDQKKIDSEKDAKKKALLQKDQAKIKVYLMIVDEILKKSSGAPANTSTPTSEKK